MVAELTGIPVVNCEENRFEKSSQVLSSSPSGLINDKITSLDTKRVRPRWITTATREPIYSFLDENDGNIFDTVKDEPIVENHLTLKEEPLYSVIIKPKKKYLDELKTVVQSREEILRKQRELHKWLDNAPTYEETMKKSSEFKRESTNGKMESRRLEPSWINSEISIPRGVVGMAVSYGKNYRNPNETREFILQEEEEEEVLGEYPADDMVSTAVDSISRFETLGRNKLVEEQEENIHAIEERIHCRPIWKIITEDDKETIIKDVMTKKESDQVSSHQEVNNANAEDIYDDNKLPKYSLENEDCFVETVTLNVNTVTTITVISSNELHDKDSLNEVGSTTGGTHERNYSGNPVGHSNRIGHSDQTVTNPSDRPTSTTVPSRSFVSRILASAKSPDHLLDHSEPYSQLWIVLSNVYGELVIVLMMALCLAEVMDTPVPLLSLQNVFLMYLYVGSIAVIISIYLWVLVDSCGSLVGNGDDAELGHTSLTRFGSLKRAHISRSKTAPTSFYIRVGALLFGLATLVFNGLEMAMHSLMQGAECLNDVVFVHPILHGMFTFLQMHFLFVNSQVLVERFGLAARFGFIHLAATNIAVWTRLIIWDSAQEWTYYVHLAQKGSSTLSSPLSLRGFPGLLTRQTRDVSDFSENYISKYQPISDEKIAQVVTLQECLNTNTLGQLWTSSMTFLYPFIVQFSLIAAAVTFVMGRNVGKHRYSHKQKFHSMKDLTGHTRVGCDGASKGLFLGILSMTAGIVVILIFLVVREDENFPPATLSWLTCGTLIGILALSALMTASGLIQIRQMSIVSRAPASLDNILSNIALFGVQLYSIFTVVVCACSLATTIDNNDTDTRGRYVMLLTASLLQLFQCFAQSTFIAEASKRSCITRIQMMAKPARQVVTFLLFSNAVLWAFHTVVTQNWVSQELQLKFFGVLAWGIISRICVPTRRLLLKNNSHCGGNNNIVDKIATNVRRDCPIHRTIPSGIVYDSNPFIMDDSTNYIRPCLESISWMYMEPNPIVQFTTPMVSFVNNPNGTDNYYRHHNHHRRRTNYKSRRRHRRIVSDPGDYYNCRDRAQRIMHRRNMSVDDSEIIENIIDVTDNENCGNQEEESRTPTFRKVPWHPNLHMLKIR
ncbi:hypothetical protein PV325_003609 [Microctonus aethiopoides]|nr:hypothetical protein PV325_003609 [Microctonus aethiopoides]